MRRTGRTTRIANEAIETLFQNGEVTFQDHFGTTNTNLELLGMIKNRLWAEHGMEVMKDYDIKVLTSENAVTLKIKKGKS